MIDLYETHWNRVVHILSETMIRYPEIIALYGSKIGSLLRERIDFAGANSKYILVAHSIEGAALEYLGIPFENILYALSDYRGNLDPEVVTNHIVCGRSFHLKACVQISSRECVCVVGSLNLTLNGLLDNDEAILVIRATEFSSSIVIELVSQLIRSFVPLIGKHGLYSVFPNWIVRGVRCGKPFSNNLHYIDNSNRSLLSQLYDIAQNMTMTSCVAFAPIFRDEGLSLTDYLKSECCLGFCHTFINEFQNICAAKWHRKVYLFSFSNEQLLFIGSPNASLASFSTSGLDILENGIAIWFPEGRNDGFDISSTR